MRATRIIYVEDDPALLGILTRALKRRPELEVLLATNSVKEVLEFDGIEKVDVALLDLALGPHQMNGIALGLALRRLHADMGIVMLSQHSLDSIERVLPKQELMGWSSIPKSGDLNIDELSKVLKSTAAGRSVLVNSAPERAPSILDGLSPRLRTVMGLAASGTSTKEIARQLDTTEGTVRQDLSRAYRILVPDATEADDLRTIAVLTFLRAAGIPGVPT